MTNKEVEALLKLPSEMQHALLPLVHDDDEEQLTYNPSTKPLLEVTHWVKRRAHLLSDSEGKLSAKPERGDVIKVEGQEALVLECQSAELGVVLTTWSRA